MNVSRRDLLKLGAGSAALLMAGANTSAFAKPPKKDKIPIGLQLYSVRHACTKDLPPVLEAVAKMGYKGVEFAGYYGRSAKELRKLLDQNGLACCGTHIKLNTLTGDALKATVEFHQTLKNPFLTVSSMPHSYSQSLETVKEVAKQYDEIAEKVAEFDMRVGYHAHGGDFKKIGDSTAWELLFENTCDQVTMQMDTGNCIGGGGDPIAILKKFPGRSATIHLKEHGGDRNAVIGEGNVDWAKVFEICETTGGTEWYIVEHERGAENAVENVKRCMAKLIEMGK